MTAGTKSTETPREMRPFMNLFAISQIILNGLFAPFFGSLDSLDEQLLCSHYMVLRFLPNRLAFRGYPFFTTHYALCTIHQQLSSLHYPLSTIQDPLSTFQFPLSTIDEQLLCSLHMVLRFLPNRL